MTAEGGAGCSLRSPNPGLSDRTLLGAERPILPSSVSPSCYFFPSVPHGGGAWRQHRSWTPVVGTLSHAHVQAHLFSWVLTHLDPPYLLGLEGTHWQVPTLRMYPGHFGPAGWAHPLLCESLKKVS